MPILAKIIEKTHLSNNIIDLEGNIKKRNFKNKIIKKNNIDYKHKKEKHKTKKKIPITNDIPVINIDIKNNKKINIITIDKNENKNKNENENNKRKCILKPSKTDIIKGTFKSLKDIIKGKLTINKYKKIANTYIKYNKI